VPRDGAADGISDYHIFGKSPYLGETVGQAQTMKRANNLFAAAIACSASAETHAKITHRNMILSVATL
jgi:hypothetical protein